MASQTKIEPVDGAPSRAPSSSTGASARVIDVEPTGGDTSAPASSIGSLAPGHSPIADDEDVSLDELMMSDSNEEDDEPDESTDVNAVSVAAERPEPAAPDSAQAFAADALEDDAAALADAAAAQEAAAQAAAEEADARVLAARRGTEPPSRAHAEHSQTVSAPSVPPVDATDDAALATESAAWLEAPPVPSGTPLFSPSVAPYSTGDDVEPPLSVELEPASQQLDPLASDRLDAAFESTPVAAPVGPPPPTVPATVAPKRRDAPLPSFDIPAESARARGAAADENLPSRVNPLPTSLSHLSEVGEEDDDDAVTHIGLPVVPESLDDYPELRPGSFEVVDPSVAALRGFDPDLSVEDARRATTRVVQRIDVAQLEPRHSQRDTNPAISSGRRPGSGSLGAWLSGALARRRSEAPGHDALPPARRRSTWLLDTVLPPLSLVLFGSGIGAGIMLLQPDRGARAAQQAQTIQALQELPAAKRATTLAERAEAGEGDALFKITNMPPDERSAALTLALERGYQAQKQNEFKEFSRLLEAPGGLATPNLTTRFLNYATSPETMLAAFAHLLTWPGATGPDVLYAVWEKAPGGNRAASLAQQLLHSADQRTKATPALITALDLRSATTCDDYLRVLPAVQRDGDQRCSATLRALKHTDGCGDDGQQDCFACLRDGAMLDKALTAIEKRIPPQL
jgi:hypothetical protein